MDRELFKLPGARRIAALAALISLGIALATIAQAWGLATAISLAWAGSVLADSLPWLGLFLAGLVARQGLVWAENALLERFSSETASALRRRFLSAVYLGGSPLVQQVGTGSASTLAIEGIDQVRSYIALVFPKTIALAVIPLALLVAIFPLDWVSGVISLVAFPCIIMFMILIGHAAKEEASKQYATFTRLSNAFLDSLRGLETLKLFGRSRAHGASVFQASERFRTATMRTLRVAMLSSAVLDLFATASLAAVAIMLGFRLIDGSIALFPALMCLMLVPEFFRPVRAYAADYHASLDGKNALAGVMDVVRKGESARDGWEGRGAAATVVAVEHADDGRFLEVSGVSFSYPGSQAPSLHEVSFSARRCERIGIVGESGAGKTTLANILAGLADPSSGSFSICDAARRAGFSASTLRDPHWLSRVAYLPQSPYLFAMTLRENIAFYRPDASAEDVASAVRSAGLEDFVRGLPEGLDTKIGAGGRALSGGQAQRVAIARVLLDRERDVLVFDEPTAHLDIETELDLKRRMLPLMEGRLVFFATHRMHWMANMDRVLVVEGGRIVQEGNPRELARMDGPFRRLLEASEGMVA